MAMTVDQNKLVTNAKYAEEVYKNEGNKYNVDNTIREIIEDNYSYKQLQQWKADMSDAGKDSNDYQIDDVDLNKMDTDNFSKNATVIGLTAAGAGGSIYLADAGSEMISTAFTSADTVKFAASDGIYSMESTAMKQGESMLQASWMLGCAMSLAVGILYQATRPNADAHDMLMQYKDLMTQYQTDIAEGNVRLEEKQQEVVEQQEVLAEQAEEKQEEIEEYREEQQEEIEEKQDEQAQLQETNVALAETLNARVAAGEPISEEDKAKLEASNEALKETNGETQEIAEETAGTVGEMQGEVLETVDTQKDTIETAATDVEDTKVSIEDMQKTVDKAASFDVKTMILSSYQAVTQTLNAVSGFKNASIASAHGILGLPFAAMGVTGAGLSTAGAIEQVKFAFDIGKEIGVRKDTQSMIDDARGVLENTKKVVDDAAVDTNEVEVEFNDDQDVEFLETVVEENAEVEAAVEENTEEIETQSEANESEETEETEETQAEQPEEGKEEKEPEEEV